jgi:hypothetical protein
LIAALAVAVVMVVAIIVVVAIRRQGDNKPTAATPSATGPVEACLVGAWQQIDYQKDIDLGRTDAGKRANLATVRMSGSGKKWTIKADGSAVEDDSNTVYSGTASDGRKVVATFSGSTNWTLKTADGKISWAGIDGNSQVAIRVDSTQVGIIKLEPNYDPTPFSCTGSVWRTSSTTDSGAFSTYKRIS